MSKTTLLITLLITSLLSSCGFHTPTKNIALNAVVNSNDNNNFTKELVKRFDQNLAQSLIIHIGSEVQKKQTASYTTDNKASSYTLSLSVPIKVFDSNRNLLLSQDLSARTNLTKIDSSQASSTQADRLQIEESYTQLRNTIIKKLLRRLNKFNEN